jgi:PKHD-type hydroxylase
MTYTTIYNDPYTRGKVVHPWIYWDQTFAEDEIAKIVEYCDNHETKRGSTFSHDADKNLEEVERFRTSNIAFHSRTPETAWIFDRLNFVIQSANEMFFNYHLNGYSFFQYTTYDAKEKGRYDWHMDMCLGEQSRNMLDIEPRKLSLTLLLNDDFEGGEFQINLGKEEEAQTIDIPKGRLIMFPSYILHRVKPITKGIRKSLVVWVIGPKFV